MKLVEVRTRGILRDTIDFPEVTFDEEDVTEIMQIYVEIYGEKALIFLAKLAIEKAKRIPDHLKSKRMAIKLK